MFKKGTFGNATVKPVLTTANYTAPVVYITTEASRKMNAYIQECNEELAWLCVVERMDETTFRIEDVMLFEQEVTAVTANICEKALNDFGSMLIQTGRTDLFNKIRGWGHSHVNMAVSPSGTDEDTFKQFYSTCEYFIRLIGNKKGEMRLDLVDCERKLQFDNLDFLEWMDEDTRQINELLTQYQERETARVAAVTALAKQEISACVKKAVSLRQSWNHREDTTTVRTGWGRWDDDEYFGYLGDDQTDSGKPGKEKEKEEKKDSISAWLYRIPVTNGRYNGYEPLEDVFDDVELIGLSECSGAWQLRNLYREDPRFSDYEYSDWQYALDEIQQYIADMMYDDEEEPKGETHGNRFQ